jgi:hypothetical protein
MDSMGAIGVKPRVPTLVRVRDDDYVAGTVHERRADLRDQLVRGPQPALGAEPVAAHHGDVGAEFSERLN